MEEGGSVEWPLGIFLIESSGMNLDGIIKRRAVGAFDKSLIIDQHKLSHRYFIPKGTIYIIAVERLLAMAGVPRTRLSASDRLTEVDFEFPVGTSAHEAINELLEAAGFNTLSFDESGAAVAGPYVFPAFRSPAHFYSSFVDSIITPHMVDMLDIASVPNVFIRKADNSQLEKPLVSRFVNNLPTQAMSTVNRGREIVDFQTVSNITSQDALDSYVKRRAIEVTQAYRHLDFTTMLVPGHGSGDTLYIDIPELFGVPLKFFETSWMMDLKPGGLMNHNAQVVVEL
jgi:hypothetical protein